MGLWNSLLRMYKLSRQSQGLDKCTSFIKNTGNGRLHITVSYYFTNAIKLKSKNSVDEFIWKFSLIIFGNQIIPRGNKIVDITKSFYICVFCPTHLRKDEYPQEHKSYIQIICRNV